MPIQCKEITELFPKIKAGLFPTVEKILKTADDYDYGFYSNNPKPFASRLIKNGLLTRVAQENWKDQIIVDLGCGRQTYVYSIACIAGAKAYVPVDKYHMPRWLEKFVAGKDWKSHLEILESELGAKFNRVPVYPIYGDMIKLLRQLPNDSVGHLIAGVDRIIISESEKTSDGKNCLLTLQKEIQRTLSPQSACVSFMSFSDLDSLQIAKDYGEDLRIFKKRS